MAQTDDDIRKKFEPQNIEWVAEHWRRTYPDLPLERVDRGYALPSFVLYRDGKVIGGVDPHNINTPRLPYWFAKQGEKFEVWLDTSCDLLQALTFVALGKGSWALEQEGA